MLQRFFRPAKAVAACLTLASAVACSGTAGFESPNAPTPATSARQDTPTPPEEPPQSGQGCTPGFWKQDQHFDSWTGYTPGQTFSSVFGGTTFGDATLLDVLGANGGGVNALGRHAVAGLLNATSAGVNYDMTSAQVIAAFNAAVAGGSVETTKNIFAKLNEQGCPLN